MMTADRIAEIRAMNDSEDRTDFWSSEAIEELLTEVEGLRSSLRDAAVLLDVAADGTADLKRLRKAAAAAREIATR